MACLRIVSRLPRPTARLFSTSPRARIDFGNSPAPPRLPEDEQKIFEKLQRQSTGAFSTPMVEQDADSTDAKIEQAAEESLSPQPARTRPHVNQSPQADNVVQAKEENMPAVQVKVDASGKGEELHPNIRRGAQPEFDGERNPKTGETGGPKNEPLRWGGQVDWSYNGRVTDF